MADIALSVKPYERLARPARQDQDLEMQVKTGVTCVLRTIADGTLKTTSFETSYGDIKSDNLGWVKPADLNLIQENCPKNLLTLPRDNADLGANSTCTIDERGNVIVAFPDLTGANFELGELKVTRTFKLTSIESVQAIELRNPTGYSILAQVEAVGGTVANYYHYGIQVLPGERYTFDAGYVDKFRDHLRGGGAVYLTVCFCHQGKVGVTTGMAMNDPRAMYAVAYAATAKKAYAYAHTRQTIEVYFDQMASLSMWSYALLFGVATTGTLLLTTLIDQLSATFLKSQLAKVASAIGVPVSDLMSGYAAGLLVGLNNGWLTMDDISDAEFHVRLLTNASPAMIASAAAIIAKNYGQDLLSMGLSITAANGVALAVAGSVQEYRRYSYLDC